MRRYKYRRGSFDNILSFFISIIADLSASVFLFATVNFLYFFLKSKWAGSFELPQKFELDWFSRFKVH